MSLKEAISGFPIVEWASRHITSLRDTGGRNARGDCPICGRHGTLSISRDKRIARCFTCEAHGSTLWNGRADLVRFIMLVLGCNRGRAIAEIFQHAGMPMEAIPAEEKNLDIPEDAMCIATSCDPDHPARQRLHERRMGRFEHQWYVCVTGRYSGRWIIPVNLDGQYRGFEAKSYCGQTPKSLTGNLAPGTVYKSETWSYSLTYAVITESVFDAESVGINSIGTFGCNVSEQQFAEILKLRHQGITDLVWLYDPDAMQKQTSVIRRWSAGFFNNRFARLPAGLDPNAASFNQVWQAINNAEPMDNLYSGWENYYAAHNR